MNPNDTTANERGSEPERSEGSLKRVVMLRCPSCKRTLRVLKDKADPTETAEIIIQCDKCWKDGTFEDPIYLDKNGKEIAQHNNALTKPHEIEP